MANISGWMIYPVDDITGLLYDNTDIYGVPAFANNSKLAKFPTQKAIKCRTANFQKDKISGAAIFKC